MKQKQSKQSSKTVEDRKSTFAYITSAVSEKDFKVININGRLSKGDRTLILNSHFTVFFQRGIKVQLNILQQRENTNH